jgi:hypothetical protein
MFEFEDSRLLITLDADVNRFLGELYEDTQYQAVGFPLYLQYRRMQRTDWGGLMNTDFTTSHGQKGTSYNQEAINLSALYSNGPGA